MIRPLQNHRLALQLPERPRAAGGIHATESGRLLSDLGRSQKNTREERNSNEGCASKKITRSR
jgi:hypothetical protein